MAEWGDWPAGVFKPCNCQRVDRHYKVFRKWKIFRFYWNIWCIVWLYSKWYQYRFRFYKNYIWIFNPDRCNYRKTALSDLIWSEYSGIWRGWYCRIIRRHNCTGFLYQGKDPESWNYTGTACLRSMCGLLCDHRYKDRGSSRFGKLSWIRR